MRREIDAGSAGDKVNHPDPAAAPLGTDDEAAGTPASAEAVRIAMEHEVNAGARSRPPDRGIGIFIAAVLLLVLLAAGWVFTSVRAAQ